MQTSERGLRSLELEEGVVLRAYLCPAGRWTIGPGLTAASGVIVPHPGMVITLEQSRDLTAQALARNYEPAVHAAMPGAAQHEFDAAVLFHWNTGAIRRASWVRSWLGDAPRPVIEGQFKAWNKGGGKVLPGLAARRGREALILFDGIYPVPDLGPAAEFDIRWGLRLTDAEKARARAAFVALGYHVDGPMDLPDAELRRFQKDNGLAADGIAGRATLSTLQRLTSQRSN